MGVVAVFVTFVLMIVLVRLLQLIAQVTLRPAKQTVAAQKGPAADAAAPAAPAADALPEHLPVIVAAVAAYMQGQGDYRLAGIRPLDDAAAMATLGRLAGPALPWVAAGRADLMAARTEMIGRRAPKRGGTAS